MWGGGCVVGEQGESKWELGHFEGSGFHFILGGREWTLDRIDSGGVTTDLTFKPQSLLDVLGGEVERAWMGVLAGQVE